MLFGLGCVNPKNQPSQNITEKILKQITTLRNLSPIVLPTAIRKFATRLSEEPTITCTRSPVFALRFIIVFFRLGYTFVRLF